MEAIEAAAFVSVGRACGFALLAIVVLMLAFAFDPVLATRVGGVLGFAVVGVLLLYGWRAPRRPYHRSEAWVILKKEHRPPPGIAQRLVGGALRDASFRFARQGAMFSGVMLALSVALKLV